MITVSQRKPYSLTRIVKIRREPDAYRVKADAEDSYTVARKRGGESGISGRSRNLRIFRIGNPLFQMIWSSTKIYVKSNTYDTTH